MKNRPFRWLQTYKFCPYISILIYGCKLRNLTYFGLFHRFQNPSPDSASFSECQMSLLIQMREQSVQWEECLECFHVPERMRPAIWHANERQVLAILSNERMGSLIEFLWKGRTRYKDKEQFMWLWGAGCLLHYLSCRKQGTDTPSKAFWYLGQVKDEGADSFRLILNGFILSSYWCKYWKLSRCMGRNYLCK